MLISEFGKHFISSLSCHHHLLFPFFCMYLFIAFSFCFKVEFEEQSRTSSEEVRSMMYIPHCLNYVAFIILYNIMKGKRN